MDAAATLPMMMEATAPNRASNMNEINSIMTQKGRLCTKLMTGARTSGAAEPTTTLPMPAKNNLVATRFARSIKKNPDNTINNAPRLIRNGASLSAMAAGFTFAKRGFKEDRNFKPVNS